MDLRPEFQRLELGSVDLRPEFQRLQFGSRLKSGVSKDPIRIQIYIQCFKGSDSDLDLYRIRCTNGRVEGEQKQWKFAKV